MIKVNIYKKEIEALDRVFNKAKVSIVDGLILGTMRVRIQQEIIKEQEKAAIEKYVPKKETKK